MTQSAMQDGDRRSDDLRKGVVGASSGREDIGVRGLRDGCAPSEMLSIKAAKAIPVKLVVEALKLKRAQGRNFYVCPKHHGGSLRLYPKNAYCFGGCRVLDNIDLVRAKLGLSFRDALRWLRTTFPGAAQGSFVLTAPPVACDSVDQAVRSKVLTALDCGLELTPTGRAYLERRGLDPDDAEQRGGFRSIDRDEWDGLRSWLQNTYSDRERASAGVRGLGRFSVRATWHEPVDALVIPYWSADRQLLTIRLRRISSAPGPRYWALPGPDPSVPFGAPWVYGHCRGRRVHITEGELDAWTLIAGHDELALGAPGVTSLKAEWFDDLAMCSELVIWGDGDEAGREFAANARRMVEVTLGASWVATHRVVSPNLPGDTDVNDLQVLGHLAAVLRSVSA